MRPDQIAALCVMVVVMIVCGFAGAMLDRALFWPDAPAVVHETPAPGDLATGLLPRDPAPADKPGQVRTIYVTVQPDPVPVECPDGTVIQAECPPVRVRTVLTRDAAGGLRANVYADDGTVISGVDVPHDPAYQPPPARPWAAGYERDHNGRQGAFVERDVGRLRVGASVVGDTLSARVGWRW